MDEQRRVIERYAGHSGLKIIEWYEETETAAKRGRPVFSKVVKLLRGGKAEGLVMHKIDRSARNYYDWAQINELADQGISIHYANENLELTSRGKRLSADIQAVFATDYIRNLREEIYKGINGRLQDGLLPWGAPLGYLNHGRGGKVKTICPVTAPLVREAFELYASGRYTLKTLREEVRRRGLCNRHGRPLTISGLAGLLVNPFFIGLIACKKRGEVYQGIHEPIISKALFDRVQSQLHRKDQQKVKKHQFFYRRMFQCATCGYSLTPERQKGHVYYRCHTSACPLTSVREEALEEAIRAALRPIVLHGKEMEVFGSLLAEVFKHAEKREKDRREMWMCQLAALSGREQKLVDAYLENALDKETFESRKTRLLMDKRAIEEKIAQGTDTRLQCQSIEKIFELASGALLRDESKTDDEKRQYIQILTSNRRVSQKSVVVELSLPFSLLANRPAIQLCGRDRVGSRSPSFVTAAHEPVGETLRHVVEELYYWAIENPDGLPLI